MPNVVTKKLTCKGTLRQLFYLSEVPLPSYDPILPPHLLHTVYVYTVYKVYLFTQGGGSGGEESYTERRLEGQCFSNMQCKPLNSDTLPTKGIW